MVKQLQSIESKLSEGRGQGLGPYYEPWLRVREVPSKGLSMRTVGWKTGRVHHFMSQLESNYFYLAEWNEEITDIREQFPLLPFEETHQIASELGIKHPKNPKTKGPVVMTTDFLVTIQSNLGIHYKAIAIKPNKDLSNKRILEKLEIEKQYWLRHRIPWEIVTENEISIAFANNIKWLHPKRSIDSLPFSSNIASAIESTLIKRLKQNPNRVLSTVTQEVDTIHNLPSGASLALVRHLLAIKKWQVDMTIPINPDRPLVLLQLPNA